MAIESLHAPWRMDYIRTIDKPGGECFLCQAASANSAQERRRHFVLWTTDHSIVLINIYPYSNGHLLVAPKSHQADFEDLTPAEAHDIQDQTAQGVRLLKRAISPQGFNIGINLGRCAGAGVPGHVHQHIVPRWAGDTNFMSVVGEIRVVPQAMSQLYEELMKVRDQMRNA